MARISMIKVGSSYYTAACPCVDCATAAGTQAKVVTVTGATLEEGTMIDIRFTNGNTHASPTLNVNSLGAKNITGNSLCAPNKYSKANSIMHLVYDGSAWTIIG